MTYILCGLIGLVCSFFFVAVAAFFCSELIDLFFGPWEQ